MVVSTANLIIRGGRTSIGRSLLLRRPIVSRNVFISKPHYENIRQQGTWASVVGTAKSLLNPQEPPPPSLKSSTNSDSSTSTQKPIIRDPLELVGKELSSLRENVRSLLGSGHPSLDTIAKYYFQAEGKHIRPLMVLLTARAINGHSPLWPELVARTRAQAKEGGVGEGEDNMGINDPLSPKDVLNDFNPHMESIEGKLPSLPSTGDAATEDMRRLATEGGDVTILPTQRRLAEITEMIHVASLLHDDVIDGSELRRGSPSAPSAFGNKLSILGGDFLLARASVALARLRNYEVIELLASVLANLVEGEVMQLQAQSSASHPSAHKNAFTSFWNTPAEQEARDKYRTEESDLHGPSMALFEHYLQKTYLKTAALIGKSTRAAAILGGFGEDAVRSSGCGEEAEEMAKRVRDAAYTFGRNIGIAFQLVDDLLDFQSTSAAFGKPSGGADLRLGLATAPVLFAWQEFPQERLGEMVKRKFSDEGDVEYALNIVRKSRGLERTAQLAKHHAILATDALEHFPQNEAKDALKQLSEKIINRVK